MSGCETCPRCGRASLDTRDGRKLCLYAATCGYSQPSKITASDVLDMTPSGRKLAEMIHADEAES